MISIELNLFLIAMLIYFMIGYTCAMRGRDSVLKVLGAIDLESLGRDQRRAITYILDRKQYGFWAFVIVTWPIWVTVFFGLLIKSRVQK